MRYFDTLAPNSDLPNLARPIFNPSNMPIINFSISDKLAYKVAMMMEEDGFVTKAEFFRRAAIDYIERHSQNNVPKNQ